MKFIGYFFILCIFISCTESPTLKDVQSFSSDRDTLILKMTKKRGYGPFSTGAIYLPDRDSNEVKKLGWFEIPAKIPKDISDIRFAPFSIYMENPRSINRDTSHVRFRSNDKNTIIILLGIKNDQRVCVIDANHNQNLTDDKVKYLKPFNWEEDDSLYRCNYTFPLNSELLQDSNWVNIGLKKDAVLMGTARHFTASFKLKDVQYELGLNGNASSLMVLKPKLALIEENGVKRDTLYARDLIDLNESIKIGRSYYKFEDFYSGSHTLVLVKDSTFERRAGVQIGMLTPSFKCISTSGDTIKQKDYHKKPILITNVSSCTPKSFKAYKDIVSRLSDNVVVIGLNAGLDPKLEGIVVDVEDEFNSNMYDLFRNAYSSYMCYLINEEGILVDKFDIFDWEANTRELRKRL